MLGLLHADLDASGSRYAPMSSADLRAQPVAFWLLGHVHACSLREGAGGTPIIYPGSPQAMDQGEQGVHGAWLLELRAGTPVQARQIPLARVRSERGEIDVSDEQDIADLRLVVTQRLREAAQELARDCGPLRYPSLCLLHRHTTRSARGDMAFGDLSSPDAVRRAMAEFDALGREAFLEKYGFGPARRYFLVDGERRYDSKAIAGVAHGYQFPRAGPLGPYDFVGGDATVRRKLEELGFDVLVLPPHRSRR